MPWIYIALIGYLLNAISFIIDKYLLSAPIPQPFAYAFWVSILSVAALALIPFGIVLPPVFDLFLSVISGAAFFCALILFYRSIKFGDVAVSATNTGVFTVLFSYIFSYLMLGERLVHGNLYGFLLLFGGLVFLAIAGRAIFHFSVLSGAMFALSLVVLKLIFNHFSTAGNLDAVFLNGIFWTRMGFVLSALTPLIFTSVRQEIRASFKNAPPKSRIVFILNKGLVGTGFLMLYYAIRQGDVVIVNALMGFQFVFVLLLTQFAQRYNRSFVPKSGKVITFSKLVGIILIFAGFLVSIVGR